MRVTLLGTGAPMHPTRATTGMVVTSPGCAPLMIDTCGGSEIARQLHSACVQRTSIRNVVITHRHLDHAGGLQALFLARIPLDIYASIDAHEGIANMTAGCFPDWVQHPEIARREVRSGSPMNIGGFCVEFFDVEHRVPTLAVRVEANGRKFAFSADCRPCKGVVDCARDADLFLCDAMCAESDGVEAAARVRSNFHCTAREAAQVAARAGARRLVCSHIASFGNPDNILAEAKANFSGAVSIGEDTVTYDV